MAGPSLIRNRALRRLAIAVLHPIWWLLGHAIPKRRDLWGLGTFPAFDDTTRAFLRCLAPHRVRLAIFVTRRPLQVPDWVDRPGVEVVVAYSLRGLWLYHRCGALFFTHWLYSFWPPLRHQPVINLWHGMPIKNICRLDGKPPSEVPRFSLTLAHDERHAGILAHAFGVARARVVLALHPRLDELTRPYPAAEHLRARYRRVALWLPTYRRSQSHDARHDGATTGDLFSGQADLADVAALFARHDALCLIKRHPLDAGTAPPAPGPHLQFIDDAWLERNGLGLYGLMGAADFLISDISSAIFDFRTTGRPVLIWFPDLHDYCDGRGFVAPLHELLAEEPVTTKADLLCRLDGLLAGPRPIRPPHHGHACRNTRTLLRRALGRAAEPALGTDEPDS